ncbi:MAG: hypothetical protein ACOX9R_01850 [Armatimonadota bacterium]|jgi:hypothetical protein
MAADADHDRVINTDRDRLIVRGREGDELRLRPWLEGANAEGFNAEFFKTLFDSDADLLAEEALRGGPLSHERIAAMLPRVVDRTFVGDPRRDERFIIEPDGSVEGLLGPLAELPPDELMRHGRWGLIDRRLPLPILRIERPGEPIREQIAVADIDPAGEPRLLVRRRVGDAVEYLAPAGEADAPAEAFADAIIARGRLVRDFHERGMTLEGGDELLGDLAADSLWLADLTMRGCHPRYGIGTYDRFKDHGFPPTVIHLGRCLLDWGHFARAAEVIGCYLDAYVSDEGTFVYYGPAVAEYGQLLSLCAHYVDLTGDARWWLRREPALRRIWGRLLALRREAVADEDAPPNARGLIAGLPEADYQGDAAQWREYYYSGDAWTVRGLSDAARTIRRLGAEEEAARIEAEVEAYRRDLLASIEASSVETSPVDADPEVYVPPGPTQTEPIARLTQDRHASYCNYRYFPEMISAGVLPARVVRRVLDWRLAHGGEMLAMTRFIDHLDDWPVLNVARALLETGEIERFELLLYAHLAHHHAAGWLDGPEQVKIFPDESGARRYHAGQVVPSQVVAPQMLRWALAYEPRDAEMLLIAPAVPADWIAHGLSARGLPTRWGRVDLSLRRAGERIEVDLRLPEGVPEVGVSLPLAGDEKLHRADIDGGLMLETAEREVFVQPEGERLRIIAIIR